MSMSVLVLIDSYEESGSGHLIVPNEEVQVESIPGTNSFIKLTFNGDSVVVSAKELQKAIENAANR